MSDMSYCWVLENETRLMWLWKSPDFIGSPFKNGCYFLLDQANGMLSVCHRSSRRSLSFDVIIELKYGDRREKFSLSNVKKCNQSRGNNTNEYLLKTINVENLCRIGCTFDNVREVCRRDLEIVKQKSKAECHKVEVKEENKKKKVHCGIIESSETRGLLALSADLRELFISEEDSDVTIQVGDQKYPVHRIILRSRSPVFRAMLKHDMMEKMRGVVDIPDCDPQIFRDFLMYLYAGKLDNMSQDNVFELYRISDKYDVKELKTDCVDFMLGNLTVDGIGDVISLASNHCESQLLSRATEFFVANAKDILPTVNWQKYIQKNPIEANELFMKAFK